MTTALIAEDEPLLAAALQAELAQLWPALRIAATVGDGASAVAQALALEPEVCFLDIRMPGLSGLEAAQALAEDWSGDAAFPLIVFVTAYDHYALQAFDAQAVDYVVKPVQRERLAACVARLQSRLAERAPPGDALQRSVEQLRALLGAAPASATPPRLDVIQAQVGAVVHLVPIDQVLYFEAADKYVRVVTAEREHLIRLSLKELLPQLDPARFWQVPPHRRTRQRHCQCAARGVGQGHADAARPPRQAQRQPPLRASVSRHVGSVSSARRWPRRSAADTAGVAGHPSRYRIPRPLREPR